MTGSQPRPCKDCQAAVDDGRLSDKVLQRRPAPYPGPRCATHWRAERNRRKAASHGRYTETTYSLAPEDYRRLYEHQGRRCAICRRATGATKRLAVDHDHACCPGPTSCGRCVRGLVCGPCNSMLAHARDDAELFRRAIRYLRDWPALAI